MNLSQKWQPSSKSVYKLGETKASNSTIVVPMRNWSTTRPTIFNSSTFAAQRVLHLVLIMCTAEVSRFVRIILGPAPVSSFDITLVNLATVGPRTTWILKGPVGIHWLLRQ